VQILTEVYGWNCSSIKQEEKEVDFLFAKLNHKTWIINVIFYLLTIGVGFWTVGFDIKCLFPYPLMNWCSSARRFLYMPLDFTGEGGGVTSIIAGDKTPTEVALQMTKKWFERWPNCISRWLNNLTFLLGNHLILETGWTCFQQMIPFQHPHFLRYGMCHVQMLTFQMYSCQNVWQELMGLEVMLVQLFSIYHHCPDLEFIYFI